jgi:hypothetical protein
MFALAFTALSLAGCEQPTDTPTVTPPVKIAPDCECEGIEEDCDCGEDCECDPCAPAHVHTYGAWNVTTPATCAATGVGVRYCTVCDEADPDTVIPIDDDAHNWNDWVITPATVTADGSKTRTCKLDGSHTETELGEYATGTPGLAFTLISSNTAYGVVKGTATASVIHIPAWHRPDADSPYLPVTRITGSSSSTSGTFGGTPSTLNTVITAVHIPASVTSISGYSAFQYCSNLVTVTFAEGSQLTSIGGYTFAFCTKLTSITIPASVTSIGSSAFQYCDSLATVTFAEGSQLTNTRNWVLINCAKLTGITIPASVTSIGTGAFSGCVGLTDITIPSNVTSIGQQAFQNCTGLTSITIPEGVTTVGQNAFNNWTASQTINVPFANADATPTGWNANWWGTNCNAIIIYSA